MVQGSNLQVNAGVLGGEEEDDKNLNTNHGDKTEISVRPSSEKQQKKHKTKQEDRNPTAHLTAPPSGGSSDYPGAFVAVQKLQQFLSAFR